MEEIETWMENRVVPMARLKEVAWFGLPKKHRGTLWLVLLDVLGSSLSDHPSQISHRVKVYASLSATSSSPLLSSDILSPSFMSPIKAGKQIEKDVKRMDTRIKGKDYSSTYSRAMFVFARTRPVIGYVQGMCHIFRVFHSVLAQTYSESEAEALSYFCFSKVVGQALDCFSSGQQGIERAIEEIEALLLKYAKEVHEHFQAIGLDVKYFAYNWMSTFLFREFEGHEKVMDAHFSLGVSSFLRFNVALAISTVLFLKDRICNSNFDEALILLQNLGSQPWTNSDIDVLLSLAYIVYSDGDLEVSEG